MRQSELSIAEIRTLPFRVVILPASQRSYQCLKKYLPEVKIRSATLAGPAFAQSVMTSDRPIR
jgi:hypothetical protein